MEEQLQEIRIFENYRIIMMDPGHSIFETEVTEHTLNLYRHTHGGYLYTLCDTAAGMAALSSGVNVVTLRADMSYIRPAVKGDILRVEGITIHDGRTTKVIESSVCNRQGKLVCKGTFTMYVTGERKP
ncbi:MAG: PaaI family thioesterase [Erysipelotrichaceae bacterium]|nr:PaaI family thioesterase [Erysipelotrichaceae bacterium]